MSILLRIETKLELIKDPINCYIILNTNADQDKVLIIDPGGPINHVIDTLETLEIIPTDIIITHGHVDHWFSAIDIFNRYEEYEINLWVPGYDCFLFERYPIQAIILYFGLKKRFEIRNDNDITEENRLEALNRLNSDLRGLQISIILKARILVRHINHYILDFTRKREIAGIVFRLFSAVGHSPGAIFLTTQDLNHNFVDQNFEGILFSGDSISSEGLGRTDIPFSNRGYLIKTLNSRIVLNKELEDYIIYPGHHESLNSNEVGDILIEKVLADIVELEKTPINELLDLIDEKHPWNFEIDEST